MEKEAVICTKCGYSSIAGKVLKTGYESHLEKLRGSWLKTAMFLLTSCILVFAAYLFYVKVTEFETEGGVLVLPKVLMLLYLLGGKYVICAILLFLSLLSTLNAIAYLPWTFIEAEWFLTFLHKLVNGIKYGSYTVIVVTVVSVIVSAYSFYSDSKKFGDRMGKVDVVIEAFGEYDHILGIQKKEFIENLVHQDKWAELEQALGDNKLLLELSVYGESRKPPHINLSVQLNSRRVKGIKGPISDGRKYKPLRGMNPYKTVIRDNKLFLSKEICESIIDAVIASSN